MSNLFYKGGRFLYRRFGISANQRVHAVYTDVVQNAESSNRMIYDLILAGKPAMVSRFGTPESKCLLNYLELQDSRKKGVLPTLHAKFTGSVSTWRTDVKTDLQDLVGFFPTTDEMLERFAAFYIEQVKKIDAIGIWGFVPGETFLIKKYCANAAAYDPQALEPYFFTNPWSRALEGKKVLVIHPFTKSIINQFANREHLFNDKSVLPAFELKTITAVQSIAGTKTEFSNWFDALASMQDQIDATDFDVAIVGAGSYGLPLSAYVKEKGKIAIHIGGATQILFGIKGKRWDDHPAIAPLYNDYWIRPDVSELVPEAKKVEGGCYW
ncbi:hypothetical protein IQ13_2426 [Lacibacter cauensis]|uniref:Uncharacterized protein n=1 Tax=Lacibacter cauensis TaxID=510947 RepID=A0A562SJS3_9BACT|nr:hypothetical protein [Lacibacter cauensis]TWI81408.1 hypothetical protein IQ13_2426 [Lacibacter cauensis]